MARKHISWKTKCAAALAQLEYMRRPGLNYAQVKALGRGRFLKRWHFDHNILHETGDAARDEFWNLTPMHVADHREKTKQDAKVIAKGRRLRKNWASLKDLQRAVRPVRNNTTHGSFVVTHAIGDALAAGIREGTKAGYQRMLRSERKRKLRSRGFDKRYRRKVDGTVVKR